MIKAAQHRFFFLSKDEQSCYHWGIFTTLIKLKFTKINKKALSAGGKRSFLRVTVVSIKVRNDLNGFTMQQFFRSTG